MFQGIQALCTALESIHDGLGRQGILGFCRGGEYDRVAVPSLGVEGAAWAELWPAAGSRHRRCDQS